MYDDDDKNIDIEALLDLAIDTAKAGRKDHARNMLIQVHRRDRRNETCLMWLAKLSPTPDERIHWLERVLTINEDNEMARKGLERTHYLKTAVENRTLMIYGVPTAVMLIVTLVLIAVAFMS